jgi:hypothetical protein
MAEIAAPSGFETSERKTVKARLPLKLNEREFWPVMVLVAAAVADQVLCALKLWAPFAPLNFC